MICSADYGSPAVIIDWAVEPEDMVDGDHPEQHGYSIPCLALFPVLVQRDGEDVELEQYQSSQHQARQTLGRT